MHGLDPVKGIVMGGAKQIVHSGIGDDELLAAAAFSVQHPGEQDSRVSDQKPSRLENDLQSGAADERADDFTEMRHIDCALGVV